jgi:hypothetical protein
MWKLQTFGSFALPSDSELPSWILTVPDAGGGGAGADEDAGASRGDPDAGEAGKDGAGAEAQAVATRATMESSATRRRVTGSARVAVAVRRTTSMSAGMSAGPTVSLVPHLSVSSCIVVGQSRPKNWKTLAREAKVGGLVRPHAIGRLY